ncbi:cation:proton antiporter [Natronococcus occultus]|uniref:Kef-type K+ transport system, membrane component n=1 Tax=Natronococcus occultus SP4 TaxID=694430 RepID=L0JYI9_9EURY|nr:cation:proton antiporter [Natronococcus occultus]AGB37360.1 Kef-type K+ transport system, membrane component [Natronococcus occultus SP4]
MTGTVALAAEFAFIILVAIGLGYAARLTGQPVLVGYIFTGLIIGPAVFGLVTETELIDTMSELGLGFLLFLVGLQLRFEDIREIFRPIVNLTVLGTVAQTALALSVAWLLGFQPTEVLVLGLASVFGATPVIVKVLQDNDQLDTLPGRIDIGVLILQNIYLVVLLAILSSDSLESPVEILTSVGFVLVFMVLIAVFSYVAARYVLPRLFTEIAGDREVLFIVGVAWAFLFIAASDQLGLSIEMGAFIAGISLAQVPQSTQLSEEIRPITDFFMLVFFTSIGLQLTAEHLLAYWREAVIASVVLMVANFVVMAALIYREQFTLETSFIGSLNMVQVSEFSLVLGALALTQGFVDEGILGYLSLVAIITMSASTYLLNYNYRLYAIAEPYLERFKREGESDDELVARRDHAVIIGHDEITRDVLPLLREEYGEVVIIDRNPGDAEYLYDEGYDLIRGDFKFSELRAEAKLERAAFALSTSVEVDVNKTLLEATRDDAIVFAEADQIDDAFELYDRGADFVIHSTVLTQDMIEEQLRTYFTDPDSFEAVRERDYGRMHWGEPNE